MKSREIKVRIVNPEASEAASINKTKQLSGIYRNELISLKPEDIKRIDKTDNVAVEK